MSAEWKGSIRHPRWPGTVVYRTWASETTIAVVSATEKPTCATRSFNPWLRRLIVVQISPSIVALKEAMHKAQAIW